MCADHRIVEAYGGESALQSGHDLSNMIYRNMARSILAVAGGIAAITVTSFAIEAVVEPLMMRTFPSALPDRTAISHSIPASLFTFGL